MRNAGINPDANTDRKTTEVSRRGMTRTLGLGLGKAALPSFMPAGMTGISKKALDSGERIVHLSERKVRAT